jgi:hypothetical protein
MKYYSETLNKVFENEKDCLNAEKEYKAKVEAEEKRKKELADSRKARAKEVEDAYKAVIDAQKHYNELKNKFVDDFGSFHMTFSTTDDFHSLFSDLFRIF